MRPDPDIVSRMPRSAYTAHTALLDRIHTGDELVVADPGMLGVYDPAAAIEIETDNLQSLRVQARLRFLGRRRTDPSVAWREVRAAINEQNRRLATPTVLAALHQRMRAFVERHVGTVQDLSWLAGRSMALPIVPLIVTGLAPRDAALVEREQEARFRDLLAPIAMRTSLPEKLRTLLTLRTTTTAIARELRGRATGTRPARDDLAQALMPFADRLPPRRLAYLVTTLLIAAAGAPGSMAASMLLTLVERPDLRERMRAEFDALAPGELYDLPVAKLAFTLRFIKEALRCWAFPLITHRVAGRDLMLRGHALAAGGVYELSSYVLHHDPRHWPDPDRFDPDRWLHPRENARKGDYLPFGFAPRACVGAALGHAQLVLFCDLMTRAFTVEPAADWAPARRWDGFAIPGDFVGTVVSRA